MQTSIFTLSFDFEIGWGDITNGEMGKSVSVEERLITCVLFYQDYSVNWKSMEIPATWATVGAMVDDRDNQKFEHLPEKARHIVTQSLATANSTSF